jgi:hypothetical protein
MGMSHPPQKFLKKIKLDDVYGANGSFTLELIFDLKKTYKNILINIKMTQNKIQKYI